MGDVFTELGAAAALIGPVEGHLAKSTGVLGVWSTCGAFHGARLIAISWIVVVGRVIGVNAQEDVPYELPLLGGTEPNIVTALRGNGVACAPDVDVVIEEIKSVIEVAHNPQAELVPLELDGQLSKDLGHCDHLMVGEFERVLEYLDCHREKTND